MVTASFFLVDFEVRITEYYENSHSLYHLKNARVQTHIYTDNIESELAYRQTTIKDNDSNSWFVQFAEIFQESKMTI